MKKKLLLLTYALIFCLTLLATPVLASGLDTVRGNNALFLKLSNIYSEQIFWKEGFDRAFLVSDMDHPEPTNSIPTNPEESDEFIQLDGDDTFNLSEDLEEPPFADPLDYTEYTDLVETEPSDEEGLLSTIDLNDELVEQAQEEGQEPFIPNIGPVSQDNTTIESLTIRWLSNSDGEETAAGFGTLELSPEDDVVRNQQFQIDLALSGQGNYEPGTIQITFPAFIWHNRNGEEPGKLTLSTPQAPDQKAEFVWERQGDNIVLINNRTLSAASRITIQGTFRYVSAHEMVNGTLSNPLSVLVAVKTPANNILSLQSNEIKAHIRTGAEISSASKTAYNDETKKYDIWWGENDLDYPRSMPEAFYPDTEHKDRYVYVRWYLTATARGNQPYLMTVSDSDTKVTKKDTGEVLQGLILGISGAFDSEQQPGGIVSATDDYSTVSATLFDGYSTSIKGCYVWTAYDKSFFEDEDGALDNEHILFYNKQISTVVPEDDGPEAMTTKQATAQFETKPPGTWTFVKIWDDNDDRAKCRPNSLPITIRKDDGRIFKYAALTLEKNQTEDPNKWVYTWSDESYLGTFDIIEHLGTAMGSFGTWYGGEGIDDQTLQLLWKYYQKSYKKEDDKRLITIENTLEEYPGPGAVESISKDVEPAYREAQKEEDKNKDLLKLLRNEPVDIRYDLRTSLYQHNSDDHVKNFILEDMAYKFDNTELSTDDVAVSSVFLNDPKAYIRDPGTRRPDGFYERIEIGTPKMILFGQYENQTDWTQFAVLDQGEISGLDHGAMAIGKRVYLPPNVKRVKAVVQSSEAQYVVIDIEVYLTIYPTETVKDMIDQRFEASAELASITMPLHNDAVATVFDAVTDEELCHENLEDDATGFLYGRQFKVAAELEKEFEMARNDIENRRVMFHTTLTLTQQSNIVDETDYYEALGYGEIPNTVSGTYYDLLPAGIDPDMNSLRAGFGDTILTYSTYPNYKNSGRTLLIVKVDETDHISYTDKQKYNYYDYPQSYTGARNYPAKGFKNVHTLDFDAYISWDTLQQTQSYYANNVAAYEADEPIIGTLQNWRGEPDDPTVSNHLFSENAVNRVADLMTDLDPNRDGESFVYASAPVDFSEIDVYAMAAIWKHVKSENMSYWSEGYRYNEVNVEEGGAYSYRLYMRSFSDTSMGDIIILDSLENYQPKDIDNIDDINDTRWKGSLVSIDVSQLERDHNIEPVIYYSTKENIDLSTYNPEQKQGVVRNILKNSGEWTTTAPEDLSEVTAIAVDASTTKDGTPFTLEENEHLEIYLNMVAPYEINNPAPDYFKGTDGTDHFKNGHAYNSVYLDCQNNTPWGVSTQGYVHYSYTKVGIFTKSMTVSKVWNDMDDRDGLRPDSVEVKLLADGLETGQSIILSKRNNWTGSFKRLHTYNRDGSPVEYSFKEVFENSDKYQPAFSVSRKGSDLSAIITNSYEPEKISIPVTKVWKDEDGNDLDANESSDTNAMEARPDYILVKLYADGNYTGKFLQLTPDENGLWSGTFTDLYKYRYRRIPIEYTIEEVQVEDFKSQVEEIDENGFLITNTYSPKGNLIVQKNVKNKTSKTSDQEFTFEIELFRNSVVDEESGETVKNYLNAEFDYKIYTLSKDGEYSVTKEGTIKNGDLFRLKDGEYLEIIDLPTHIQYSVSEFDVPGYTASSQNASGEILSYIDQKAVFTNTYTTSGYVALQVKKVLDGTDISPYQFAFKLYRITEDSETELSTALNNQDGMVFFNRINYSQADENKTFTYKIVETQEQRAGYNYSDQIYYAQVTPRDKGDGTMETEVRYFDRNPLGSLIELEGSEEIPVITNEYRAQGEVELRAWKSLTARTPSDKEFTFDLYQVEPELKEEASETKVVHIDSAQNDANALILFSPITYTQYDCGRTFLYFAREREGHDETVIYDKNLVGYAVTVRDNGNGTLSLDQKSFIIEVSAIEEFFETCPELKEESNKHTDKCRVCNGLGLLLKEDFAVPMESETPVFSNALEPGALAVQKRIEPGDYDYDSDQEFTFKIRFTGENLPEELSYTRSRIEDQEEKAPTSVAVPQDTRPVPETIESVTETIEEETSYEEENVSEITDQSVNDTEEEPAETIALMNDEPQPVSEEERTIVHTGTSKTTVWTIYSDGVLELKPLNGDTGELIFWGNSTGSIPWQSYKKEITEVRIPEGKIKMGMSNMNTGSTYGMFQGCTNLVKADLSNLETSKVTWMGAMFSGCTSLESLNLSGFKTSDVTTGMESMFENCSSLKELDLTSFSTDKVKNMALMFSGCSKLERLDLSSFNLSSATATNKMFYNCSSLETLLMPQQGSSDNVTTMDSMFQGCSSLKNIDLSHITTPNVTKMESMFSNCSSLQDLNLLTFDTSKVTTMVTMFNNCKDLKSLELLSFNTENVTSMQSMFNGCSSLTALELVGFNTEKVTTMYQMFMDCASLKSLSLSNLNASSVTSMQNMFNGCTQLEHLDLSNMSSGKVTNMQSMFQDCQSLSDLNLSGIDTGRVQYMQSMFMNCMNLETLDVSDLNTENVTNMSSMFQNCSALVSLDLSNLNTGKVTSMSTMFSGCSSLEELNLENINTEKVTAMGSMFRDCGTPNLSLDLSGFVISNRQGSMATSMLENCHAHRICFGEKFFDFTQDPNLSTSTAIWVKEDTLDSDSQLEETLNKIIKKGRSESVDTYKGWWWLASDFAYSVSFQNADGSTGTMDSIDWYCYRELELPENSLFNPGYHLVGWHVEELGDNYWLEHQRGNILYALIPKWVYSQVDLTLTPIWIENDPNAYTLIFDSQGEGTVSSKIINVPLETKYILEDNGFTKYGAKLVAWEDPDGVQYPLGSEIGPFEAGYTLRLKTVWKDIIASSEENEFEFKLKDGERMLFNEIPAGISYEVWELTPDGWNLVSAENTSGIIGTTYTSQAEFVNTYNPEMAQAAIRATKLYDGQGSGTDGESNAFEFEITKTKVGSDETYPSETLVASTGGQIEFMDTYFEPGTFVYELREIPGNNSEIDYDPHTITAIVVVDYNESGELCTTVFYDSEYQVFTNTTLPGQLEITKNVVNESLKTPTPDLDFSFEVSLFDQNGLPILDGETFDWYISGDEENIQTAVAQNGMIRVQISAGQTAIITGLKKGMSYLVAETDLPSGWTQESASGLQGMIEAGKTASAEVTNVYAAKGVASLEAYKQFDGELEAGQFTFVLLDESGQPLGMETTNMDPDSNEYIADASGENIKNPKYGLAPVRFNLSYDTPGTFIYYIKEKPDPAQNEVVYDERYIKYSVTVTDTGTGYLETQVEYLGQGPGIDEITDLESQESPIFVNHLRTGALTLKKELTNTIPVREDQNPLFSFTVYLSDHDGTLLEGSYPYSVSDGKTTGRIQCGETASLEAGQSLKIYELPIGAQYTVEEIEQPNYRLVSATDASGTIESQENTAVFRNAYTKPGEIVLRARKLLNGQSQIPEHKFSFNLINHKEQIIQTVEAEVDGSVIFAPINFTEKDSGYDNFYYIEESRIDEDPNIEYDRRRIKIHLTVDIDSLSGELITHAEYLDQDNNPIEEAVFENTTRTGGLEIEKIVRDTDYTGEPFSFRVILYRSGEDGERLIASDISGTYGDLYFIEGIAGGEGNEILLSGGEKLRASGLPSDLSYSVTELESGSYLPVESSKEGAIKAGETVTETFYNLKPDQGLVVSKQVSGRTGETERAFNFTVVLSDNTISGKYGDMVFSQGVATFILKHDEIKLAQGLPAGLTYTVTETEANQDGYETTVQGDAVPDATNSAATGTIPEDGYEQIRFINSRDLEPEILPETGALSITKKVVSAVASDLSTEYFFIIRLTGKDSNTVTGLYGDIGFSFGSARISLKDGETKTATGLPAGLSYTVEEEIPENFIAEAENDTGSIVIDQSADVVFTNTRQTSDLEVSKTVIGSDKDQARSFRFKITLSESLSGDFGEMHFEEGVTTFSLRHQQTKTASGLPVGISYEVEELDSYEYLVISENENGIISNKTSEVFFTNVKEDRDIKKTITSINGETVSEDDLKMDSRGVLNGPVVSVGDTITYQIYWINDSREVADILIEDVLDSGVDFISASDNGKYDSEKHAATWEFKEQAPGASGRVSLEVRVNETADSYWSYESADPEEADHQIINRATVKIDNQSRMTNTVRNPIEGLYIEKIHAIVSIPELNDQYDESVFESDNVFDLPQNAYDSSYGMGFTELLDTDTAQNAYKKTFVHDYENTVRYYIKVTNNYKEDLNHVIIMDPVRVNSLQSTNSTKTTFTGVAGTINNEPMVEGRTQSRIAVREVEREGNQITYRITAEWSNEWGNEIVRIEDIIPDDTEFVSAAFYEDPESRAKNSGLVLYADGDQTSVEDTQNRTENGDPASKISIDGKKVSWKYWNDEDESLNSNILYLTIRCSETSTPDAEGNYNGTIGGFVENIQSSYGYDQTNNVKAIYNPDDIDNDGNTDQSEGYLRWEFETLPGTDAAASGELSPDGYPKNVQIVYFDWKMPDSTSVSEYTSWKNTAYVQTMDKLLENLFEDPEIPEEKKEILREVTSDNTETYSIGNRYPSPILQLDNLLESPVEVNGDEKELVDENILYSAMSLDESEYQHISEESTDEFLPDLESEFNGDNSTDDHVSVYSLFGWRTLQNAMIPSNTVREVINAGNLEITKKVEGEKQTDKEFSFDIHLDFTNALSKDEEVRELDGTFTFLDAEGNATEYSVVDGKGSFNLRNGETLRLENIPVNTVFRITETSSEGYSVSGQIKDLGQNDIKTVNSNNIEGTITTSNSDVEVVCVNTPEKTSQKERPKDPDTTVEIPQTTEKPSDPPKDPETETSEKTEVPEETENMPQTNEKPSASPEKPSSSDVKSESERAETVEEVASQETTTSTKNTVIKRTGVTQTGISPQTGVSGGISAGLLFAVASGASYVEYMNKKKKRKK